MTDSNSAFKMFVKNDYKDDKMANQRQTPTYINTALYQENQIDYILTSAPSSVSNFQVLDPSVNFSDHVPVCMSVILTNTGNILKSSNTLPNYNDPTISQLRWDKGDKASYYYHTGHNLLPLIDVHDNMLSACNSGIAFTNNVNVNGCIDAVYASIVSTLRSTANTYIPKCRKGFLNTGGMKT